jgi:hypothetical protein
VRGRGSGAARCSLIALERERLQGAALSRQMLSQTVLALCTSHSLAFIRHESRIVCMLAFTPQTDVTTETTTAPDVFTPEASADGSTEAGDDGSIDTSADRDPIGYARPSNTAPSAISLSSKSRAHVRMPAGPPRGGAKPTRYAFVEATTCAWGKGGAKPICACQVQCGNARPDGAGCSYDASDDVSVGGDCHAGQCRPEGGGVEAQY